MYQKTFITECTTSSSEHTYIDEGDKKMTIEVEGATTRGSSAILLRLVVKILLD
jgi:hypothetical protein